MTKGELIVGRFQNKISAVLLGASTTNWGQFCLWMWGSTAMRLAFLTCQAKIFRGKNFRRKKFSLEEIFAGRNFHNLAFDCKNRENFYLAKIYHYTVLCWDVYLITTPLQYNKMHTSNKKKFLSWSLSQSTVGCSSVIYSYVCFRNRFCSHIYMYTGTQSAPTCAYEHLLL